MDKKAFANWLHKTKGYARDTAATYSNNINTSKHIAGKLFQEYLATALPCELNMEPTKPAPQVLDVELPTGVIVSARPDDYTNFPAGLYLIDIGERGFKLYPTNKENRTASYVHMEQELERLKAENSDLKTRISNAESKWSSLQSLLSNEHLTK